MTSLTRALELMLFLFLGCNQNLKKEVTMSQLMTSKCVADILAIHYYKGCCAYVKMESRDRIREVNGLSYYCNDFRDKCYLIETRVIIEEDCPRSRLFRE